MGFKREKDYHIGFRIDRETHDKFWYVAEYEGRTGNGQMVYLMRQCIEEFERAHGPINLEE